MTTQTTWPTSSPINWTVCQTQLVLSYQWEEARIGDEIVTAFRDGQVTLRKNRREAGFTNALKEIGYQHISKGSLVVHSMDGGFGAIGVSDSDGKASPVVHAYESEHCDLRFVAYFLRAAVDAGWVAANGKGIRQRSTQFDRPALAQLKIAFPSLEHQQRIADFLDRETGEIDAMIAKMDELAGQLEVRRRTAIQAAALGSFSPVGGAISGVPIGAVGAVVLGKMLDAKRSRPADATDLPYIRAANIQSDGLRLNEVKTMPFTPREVSNLDLRKDDILVVEGGAVGTAVLLTEDMGGWSFQKTVNRIRPGCGISSRWLTYVLRSYRDEGVFDLICSGTTIAHLTAEKLSALRVPLLDLDEQQRIADHLDEVTGKIDQMLAKVAELKSLLTERRAALITEVVTGRKDVA